MLRLFPARAGRMGGVRDEAAFQTGVILGRVIGAACVLTILVVVGVSMFMVIKVIGKKKPPA